MKSPDWESWDPEEWMPSDELHDLIIDLISQRDAKSPEEQVLQDRLFAMFDDGEEVMVPFDLPDPAAKIDIQEMLGILPIEDFGIDDSD